jgi:hypothetical protein
MFRGYKINGPIENATLYEQGVSLGTEHSNKVYQALKQLLSPDGVLDGSKIEGIWFPQIEADIFVSHSHRDEGMALTLAGWLWDSFRLVAFVDSCVWKYSDELLKGIDNRYCLKENKLTYSYERRNRSTAHVHMMLGMALAKMMNDTECLFLLNTPNSVTPSDMISDENTYSPWIYYEIGISSMIQKPLNRHKRKHISKGRVRELLESERRFDIKYRLPTNHLTEIGIDKLNEWQERYVSAIPTPEYALDSLYEIT